MPRAAPKPKVEIVPPIIAPVLEEDDWGISNAEETTVKEPLAVSDSLAVPFSIHAPALTFAPVVKTVEVAKKIPMSLMKMMTILGRESRGSKSNILKVAKEYGVDVVDDIPMEND